MGRTVFELKVSESNDGYELDYKGDKSYWIRKYGSHFQPTGSNRYVVNVGSVAVHATPNDDGFHVEFIGDKQLIRDHFLRRLEQR